MTMEYYGMLNAVEKYYGSGSDQWLEIAKYGIAADNAESILSQVPGVQLIKNSDGSIRSYTYNAFSSIKSSSSIAEELNSNLQSGTASIANNTKIKIPSNMGVNETGKLTLKSGMKTAGKFVFGEVAPAIAAAGVGISLGKAIDKTLYNLNPDFWDEHGLSTLNPETWNSITSDNASLNARLFNIVFGIDDDSMQGYIDENAYAYLALLLQKRGVFNVGEEVLNIPTELPKPTNVIYPIISGVLPFSYTSTSNKKVHEFVPSSSNVKLCAFKNPTKAGSFTFLVASNEPFTIGDYVNGIEQIRHNFTKDSFKFTYNDKTIWSGMFSYNNVGSDISTPYNNMTGSQSAPKNGSSIAWTLVYGNNTHSGGIEGINDSPNSTLPNLSDDFSIEQTLQALKDQYPELWNKAVTQDVVQPDGSVTTYNYIPFPIPEANSSIDTKPVSGNASQSNALINPDTSTQTLIDLITSIINTPPTNTDIPDTGSGDTPTTVIPSGSASALYSIYNPSQADLNNFGAWLWSNNFVDQLLKLFSSPMDAIIGLHKIYATPATGGPQNIKVGYIDSNVPSKIVTKQYTTIDCGTVNCYEYFGNVLDYNPYTNIRLYLPFIGIIDLSNSDVMRSKVNVVYHVDILTGACLAEVKITRDGGGGTLYQYAGNAATTLPISSGSYMGVVSSVSSVATRALAGFASGGALGAIASGATGILNAQGANVVHSGGFSGNAGAMGCKKPYLIIERPQTETADNTAKLLGYGSNLFTKLKTCKGLTKVKGVHVDAVPATNEEKKLIEDKLLEGIVIR